jgi:copper chaperone CopZ
VSAERPLAEHRLRTVSRLRLLVPGMTARSSVRVVTAHLRDVPGVTTLAADPATGELWVTGELLEEDLLRELAGIGFPATAPGTWSGPR